MTRTSAHRIKRRVVHAVSVLGGMIVIAGITVGCSKETGLTVEGTVTPPPQISMTPVVSAAPNQPTASGSAVPSADPGAATAVPSATPSQTPFPTPSSNSPWNPSPEPTPSPSLNPSPTPASTATIDDSSSANEPGTTVPTTRPDSGHPAPAADISVTALLQEMREGLGIVPNASGTPFIPPSDIGDWLNKLSIKYDSNYGTFYVHTIQVGKDGGLPTWAAVLYVEAPASEGSKKEQSSRQSIGVIVTQTLGGYVLGTVEFPMDFMGTSKVEIPGDLTGDGNKEIVWNWVVDGAHTSTYGYVVTQWEANKWSVMPGEIVVRSVSSFQLFNGALIIKGGLVGSAGAGPWQREATQTYKYKDGSMKLNESIKVNGTTAYHNLEDALTSEALGYWERAAQQFTAAVNRKDESYQDLRFEYQDKMIEGNTNMELENRFRDAVNAFARLRLQLIEFDHHIAGKYSSLLGPDKGSYASLSEALFSVKNREEAIKVVQEWSVAHPDWLKLLNAPFGYVNQRWDKENISEFINVVNEL